MKSDSGFWELSGKKAGSAYDARVGLRLMPRKNILALLEGGDRRSIGPLTK